jgi:hypothetical protein
MEGGNDPPGDPVETLAVEMSKYNASTPSRAVSTSWPDPVRVSAAMART